MSLYLFDRRLRCRDDVAALNASGTAHDDFQVFLASVEKTAYSATIQVRH